MVKYQPTVILAKAGIHFEPGILSIGITIGPWMMAHFLMAHHLIRLC